MPSGMNIRHAALQYDTMQSNPKVRFIVAELNERDMILRTRSSISISL